MKSVFHLNCSLRVAFNRTIYQKMWRMSVFGVFNKAINFITESVKKTQQFKTWNLFIGIIILLKISVNIHLKWKISTRPVFLNWRSFAQYGVYFDKRPEMLICHQIFQEIFHAKPCYKRICILFSVNSIWVILTSET